MTKKQTGLQLAIAHAGSGTKLARALGVPRSTVYGWLEADAPTPPPDSAVLKAITAAGGLAALGRALGVTPQAIQDWRRKGYVPPARAKEIEMQYGIPRNDLVSAKVRSNLGLGGDL
ncbi:MAG: YdaS family helix-turn-helix protein [Novosphingobium sp.]|nr:YdaS family helix-turn-helix protein [Novosphingobium sp.]